MNKVNRVFYISIYLLFFCTMLSGCFSSTQVKSKEALSHVLEKQQYQKASKLLQNKKYHAAIEALTTLLIQHPFGLYADQARLELAYAQTKARHFPEALVNIERFIRLNVQHHQIDYAYYLKSVIIQRSSHHWLENIANYQVGEITPLHQALEGFSEFIKKFPNSKYKADAIHRMHHIKDQIAEYTLSICQQYMVQGAYQSAVKRAKSILTDFNGTSSDIAALKILIQAYEQLNQHQHAQEMRTLLLGINKPSSVNP